MKTIHAIFSATGIWSVLLLGGVMLNSCDRPSGEDTEKPMQEQHDHNHDHNGDHDHDHDEGEDHAHAHQHGENEVILLTEAQVRSGGIRWGKPSRQPVGRSVDVTGVLDLPPESRYLISAPIDGILFKVGKHIPGSTIRKGQVIAYIKNPQIAEWQGQYLEYRARIDFLEKELQRLQALYKTDRGMLRELQRTEMELASTRSTLQSVQKKLQYLGIDGRTIQASNIRYSVPIRSEKHAEVITSHLSEGMPVQQGDVLLETISDPHVHLELDVPESQIHLVKKGQEIIYSLTTDPEKYYTAEVELISKGSDRHRRTVRVHGHLTGEWPAIFTRATVSARIILDDQTADALPEEAIVRKDEQWFVYLTDGKPQNGMYHFIPEPIRLLHEKPGGEAIVSFFDPLEDSMYVVLSGSFFLKVVEKSGELEHTH